MKRILLIAGGTVGGLGAVLALTPPQLTSTSTVRVIMVVLSSKAVAKAVVLRDPLLLPLEALPVFIVNTLLFLLKISMNLLKFIEIH